QAPRPDDVALPGEFVEGARAHAVSERGFAFDLGVAAVGEEVGVLGCHLTCNDTMMFRPKDTLAPKKSLQTTSPTIAFCATRQIP
ncbi:MAG: hypothetical protein M9918_26220, partial [Anaerolineae bacterium]|nr:hypothetical protein [Anaerolineae bacterium]